VQEEANEERFFVFYNERTVRFPSFFISKSNPERFRILQADFGSTIAQAGVLWRPRVFRHIPAFLFGVVGGLVFFHGMKLLSIYLHPSSPMRQGDRGERVLPLHMNV
jgi:hypothetical protein